MTTLHGRNQGPLRCVLRCNNVSLQSNEDKICVRVCDVCAGTKGSVLNIGAQLAMKGADMQVTLCCVRQEVEWSINASCETQVLYVDFALAWVCGRGFKFWRNLLSGIFLFQWILSLSISVINTFPSANYFSRCKEIRHK